MDNKKRLIDADELVKRLKELRKKHPIFAAAFSWVETIIHQATIVDAVEVVHGRWVFRKNWDFFVCSECSHESSNYAHYCPNCGAKMDGDVNV